MHGALLPGRGRPWPWHTRHAGSWRVGQACSSGLSSCARQCGLQEGQGVGTGVALGDDNLCVQSDSCGALQVPRKSALPGIWWFEWLQCSSVRNLWLEENFVITTQKKSSSCGIQLLLTSTCKSIKTLETSQLMLHKHTLDLHHSSGWQTAEAFKTL